jgi:RimJ/RimL family protein N-acetyltransferase
MRFIGSGRIWSAAEADEVFERALAHWREHEFGWRSLLDKASGEWFGFAGLNHRAPGATEMAPDEVEIGWWLVRRAWGRGIATEAASQVRDEGFARVGLDRIIARLQIENVASARVAEKLGMAPERHAIGRHGDRIVVYSVRRRGTHLLRGADSRRPSTPTAGPAQG